MYMKSYRIVGSVGFLIIIFLIFFIKYKQTSLSADTVNSNAESADITLTGSDVKSAMREIDLQVKKIENRINFNYNKDYYYDEDIPMFRQFENIIDQETFTHYDLYYNEQGKLIYAEITHYRGPLYSIYYHKDELMHVEVGPFYEGGLSVNGDMADVEATIKKDSDYAFILEDNSLCLEYAYSP